MASGSDIGYGILLVAGFIAIVAPPFYQLGMGNKLDKNDYMTQVAASTLVGILAFGIAIIGLSQEHYNETSLFFITLTLLMGTLFISLGGIIIYTTRLRYASG